MTKRTEKQSQKKKRTFDEKRNIIDEECGGPCHVLDGDLCQECAEWGRFLSSVNRSPGDQ